MGGETYDELVALFANVRQRTSRSGTSLLGLFKDEPLIVDEAMGHVRELRQRWRSRATQSGRPKSKRSLSRFIGSRFSNSSRIGGLSKPWAKESSPAWKVALASSRS